ncbi:MAG: hypothetical protein ABIK62_03660, partial [candidate division WOR-3 bacterium]
MSSLDRDQKVAPTDHRRRKGLRVSIASCSAASVKRGASGAERLAASALLLLLARLSAQPLVPVDSIRCFRPSGVPADSGLVVRVTGVFSATGQFGSWGPGFVQDNTAGVAVYDSAVARFAIGDSVLITARIDFYNGLTELKNPSISRISSGHELEPRPILIAQMGDTLNNRELYEGRLVTCHGIFDTTGTFQGNRSYPFRDA